MNTVLIAGVVFISIGIGIIMGYYWRKKDEQIVWNDGFIAGQDDILSHGRIDRATMAKKDH